MASVKKVLVGAIGLRVVLVAVYLAFSGWVPYSDIHFYYDIALRSDRGQLPFLHFWMEYPPVFPFLVVGLYQLLGALGLSGAGYFYLASALFMSVVDLANLLLLYRLVSLAHGPKRAGYAAIIYAGVPTFVWFSIGWFDALGVAALLAGLLALACRRPGTAGVLAGVGAMIKFFPAALLLGAPIIAARGGLARMALLMLASVAAILVPLAVARPDLLGASFASMFTREPWESVWALLGGNYAAGTLPPIDQRFTAESAFLDASTPFALVATLVQVGLGLVAVGAALALARASWGQPRALFQAVTFAVAALLLGSKGFSPQFVTWLLPLVLLVWPNAVGLAYVAGFAVYVLLSYSPAYFVRGLPERALLVAVWSLVVLWRSLLLLLLAGHLIRDARRGIEHNPIRPVSAAVHAQAGPT